MTQLPLWLAGVGYLLLHLLAYLVVLRRFRAFVTERGAFRYHLASAMVFTLVVAGLWLLVPASGVSFAVLVGLVMLHGIYSLSFLEVWSLTEGSYSLQIVRAVVESNATRSPLDMQHLEGIGSRKKLGRTDTLVRLGLVSVVDGQVSLTPRGRTAARALGALRSLVDTRTQVKAG
ncbi:MAG: hypothetical protein IT306_10735 [Chloroflexi bacterium]|nr:hypothetical protein [Chloroflexota bacterium]